MLPITQERLLPLVSTAVEIWHWGIVQPYVSVCVCVSTPPGAQAANRVSCQAFL